MSVDVNPSVVSTIGLGTLGVGGEIPSSGSLKHNGLNFFKILSFLLENSVDSDQLIRIHSFSHKQQIHINKEIMCIFMG